MEITWQVRQQYERFPYPPLSRFALPRRDQGTSLSFEAGSAFAFGAARSHKDMRILVAGAGTFETLVAAQMHPQAREVVAVDFSEASLRVLRRRLNLARWTRRLPPVKVVCADLHDWAEGEFDLVLASNLLQHVPEPAALFRRMASWLRPDGLLRIVTYPKASRIWMRETSRWLRLNGLTPESDDLLSRARSTIRALPESHPVRSCFESQPEIGTSAGLVDAFLHAWERPLSPLEWQSAAHDAGLILAGEAQTETSRSAFLNEIAPELSRLTAWTKLQLLDDALELCANPVLWFKRGLELIPPGLSELDGSEWAPESLSTVLPAMDFTLVSAARFELGSSLRRISALLQTSGKALTLERLMDRLRTEVGPRFTAPPEERILPGLSITEYPSMELLQLPRPPGKTEWDALEARLKPGSRLGLAGAGGRFLPAQGLSLAEQAAWLQIRHGALLGRIPVRIEEADFQPR